MGPPARSEMEPFRRFPILRLPPAIPLMNNPFRLLLFILALAVAACDSSGADSDPVGAGAGEVAIEIGETESLAGLSVTFERVVEDSRCPEGVDCLVEGEARVALRVGSEDVELLVVDPRTQPSAGVRVGGRILFAVRLLPEPSEINPSDAPPVVTVAAFDVAD